MINIHRDSIGFVRGHELFTSPKYNERNPMTLICMCNDICPKITLLSACITLSTRHIPRKGTTKNK